MFQHLHSFSWTSLRAPSFTLQIRKSTNLLFRQCICWMKVWRGLHLTLVLPPKTSSLSKVPILFMQLSLSTFVILSIEIGQYYTNRCSSWCQLSMMMGASDLLGFQSKSKKQVTWPLDGKYTYPGIKLVSQEASGKIRKFCNTVYESKRSLLITKIKLNLCNAKWLCFLQFLH